MENVILLCAFLFFFQGYDSFAKTGKTQFKNHYYSEDGYNQLEVFFRESGDSVFLFYLNVVENGNYLNGYSNDTSDFAGYFLKDHIVNDSVTFKIKNYRQPEYEYDLTLCFRNNDSSILWKILDDNLSYMPKAMSLKIQN